MEENKIKEHDSSAKLDESLETETKTNETSPIKKITVFATVAFVAVVIAAMFLNAGNSYENVIKKAVDHLEKENYYELFQMSSETSFLPETSPSDFSRTEAINFITETAYPDLIEDFESGAKLEYTIVSAEKYTQEDIDGFKDIFIKAGTYSSVIKSIDIEEIYLVTYTIKNTTNGQEYTMKDYVIKENGKWKIRLT